MQHSRRNVRIGAVGHRDVFGRNGSDGVGTGVPNAPGTEGTRNGDGFGRKPASTLCPLDRVCRVPVV